jgi:Fe-S-cluster containining protein
MDKDLWHDCLVCEDKCCKWDLAHPLFVTPEEKKQHLLINTINQSINQCIFFTQNELCEIHQSRPYDCRFFPFDLMELNNSFYWIIWGVSCNILRKRQNDFEQYLIQHEKLLLPNFFHHIKAYAEFRVEELKRKYKFEVLREVRIGNNLI